MTYICAIYISALLIAVDIPLCSTRPCRPERRRFKFLIPVDVQLYRAGDIHLRQICFLRLIGLIYRSGRHGCVVQNGIALSFRWLLIYSCARYASAVLIAVEFRAIDIQLRSGEPLFEGRPCNEFLQDVLAHVCPRYLHRHHPTLTLTLTLTPTRPLTV